jgi:hypothetical protein
MAERCSWLQRYRKASSAFNRFSHCRGTARARATATWPQASARYVAVLKSECIHRLDGNAQRGGLPHNLHSGDTAAQGGTADATEWDGRGLERVDRLARGLAKLMRTLQDVLDSAFLQVAGRYTSVSSALWELTIRRPASITIRAQSSTQPLSRRFGNKGGQKGRQWAALADARKPEHDLGHSHGRQPCTALSAPGNTFAVVGCNRCRGLQVLCLLGPSSLGTKTMARSSGCNVSLATTFKHSVSHLRRHPGCARCTVAVHV